jgi:hypothetical protein
MIHGFVSVILSFVVVLMPAAAGAEVLPVCERSENSSATADFRFRTVPPPSKSDAATNARFSVVAGDVDPHGGDVETLQDGRLPESSDHPDANFFFDAGTAGGRLLLDLGSVIDVQQVNTYSWHANKRGPQVYQLYASDGSAPGFVARPGRGVALPQVGWNRIASVDTRPAQGTPGGQYGVSIADRSGGSLGRFRYLLFDISRTDDRDRFGNTFFSEIDVCDGQEHAARPAAAEPVEFVFDTSETPDLQPWVETRLRPVCERWYPRIVAMLPSPGYTAPRRVSITFRKDMQGVAGASGTRIVCAGDWFRRNLEGEAAGAVVHELVHVVQRYGRVRNGRSNPGWLVEGVADYIRWFHFEPPSQRPRPNPATAHYTDSYRTTAAFLNYVAETQDQDIVKKLNTAMREGRYTAELWKEHTGKTVDELWEGFVAFRSAKGRSFAERKTTLFAARRL